MALSLPMLEWLITEGHGDITLGRIGPISCAATACDEDAQLAMLIRRDGESLTDLLCRLDKAINMAYEEEIYIDEINNGPDYSI